MSDSKLDKKLVQQLIQQLLIYTGKLKSKSYLPRQNNKVEHDKFTQAGTKASTVRFRGLSMENNGRNGRTGFYGKQSTAGAETCILRSMSL